MLRSPLLLACLSGSALLALFSPGCSDDPEFAALSDAGPADGAIDSRPPPVPAPFGLDSRPQNATCKAPAPPPAQGDVELKRVFPRLNFTSPVFLTQAPGDATRFFVVEQAGSVKVFPNKPDPDPSEVKTFIDISTSHQVDAGGEKGLLGFAFHPKWPANPSVYLSYTRQSGDGNKPFSRITKFTSGDGGQTANNGSGTDVFDKVQQPFSNHNGGFIAFGKDGYLYYGLGDGGSGNDPLGSGQDTNSFLGKILRFDVDKGSPYAIPMDNPFATSGGKPEIYAYGFRNPWRFSFDRATGDLWAGDVGQDVWEEVDKVQLGGNYGWKICEGTHLRGDATNKCNLAGAIDSVAEYQHGTLGGSGPNKNAASVTGGYVYRGTALQGFAGSYFYGDFQHGQVWALQQGGDGKYASKLLTAADGTPLLIASFAEDLAGELYIVNYAGNIYQIAPKGAQPPDTFPQKLSDTGCVDKMNPKEPASGLIPYGSVSPLWSDGADKQRWVALPDGATIDLKDDGDFDFPKGTVLMKSFYVGGKIVETRLFMRHNETGEWGGYTYEWDDAGTDATLLPSSKLKDVGGGQSWYYPSRGECFTCHTVAAGRSLGLEIAQLNSDFVYPNNRLSNQLATFEHIGVLSKPLPGAPSTLPAMKNPTADGDLAMRARSYLHSNCSHCHRPQGGTRSEQDWRFSTPLSAGKACNQDPTLGDLGITGGKILFPGDATKSILSKRMHSLDVNRMPPLATRVIDAKGVQVVDDWIKGLTDCK